MKNTNEFFKNITIATSFLVATALVSTSAFAQGNKNVFTQPVEPAPTLQTSVAPSQPSFNLNGFRPFNISVGAGAGTNGGGVVAFLGEGFGQAKEQGFSNTNILLNAQGNACDTTDCNAFGFKANVEAGHHANSIAEATGHTPDMQIQTLSQTMSNSMGSLSFSAAPLQPATSGSNNP